MDGWVRPSSSGDRSFMSVDTPPDGEPPARPSRRGAGLVPRVIGALLCLAAGLKIFDLFDSYGAGVGWTIAMTAASVELLIGAALVLRVWPSVVEPVGGLLFVLLGSVALIATTRGAALCGCLGEVPMPPWVLLIFDAAAAVALLWKPRTSGRYRGRHFGRLDAACAGAFFVGATIGSVLYERYIPVTRAISEELIGGSNPFTIDPNRFRGQPFFLRRFIRIDADLSRGRWKVILTRPGCRKCDRLIRSEGCQPEGDERVAVVLTPRQGADDRDWELPEGCQAIRGELDPKKTWEFQPPLVFHLKDNKVIEAR